MNAKTKRRVGNALYYFLIYYLTGLLLLSGYLVWAYPGGVQCLKGDNCRGVQTMLTALLKSPQFWTVHVPLWPVIVSLDFLNRK